MTSWASAHSSLQLLLEWCWKFVTGMDDPNENELGLLSFKRFLATFCRDVEEPSSEENDSPIRHVSYMLEASEIEGESLQWALDYLCQTHGCPHGLAEQVAREAFRRAQQDRHPNENGKGDSSGSLSRVELRHLQREIEVQVYKVCVEWNQQLPGTVGRPLPTLPVSVHAIKNTRRRMEDRHVILPDLNTLFQLQAGQSQSYYAVFDGHGGAEAAMFSTSQLHVNLLRDANFHSNPELALKRAYATTDRQFLKKAEEQKLRSGTTGVSVLLRGDYCYIAWLGDSQVTLVREGRAITLMEPHKPSREDEKKRIEQLGGFVSTTFGVWRVNGSVSVSRAIGDLHVKPYLCSEADTKSFKRTGTEDYLVLACDGVWDVLAPPDIPFLVHSFLVEHPNQHSEVAKHLVTKAKEMGSGDNISCIVVFLRRDIAQPIGFQFEGFNFVRANGKQQDESLSEITRNPADGNTPSEVTNMSKLTLSSAADESGSLMDNVMKQDSSCKPGVGKQ